MARSAQNFAIVVRTCPNARLEYFNPGQHEIYDAKAQLSKLVDQAANEKPFVIAKNATADLD